MKMQLAAILLFLTCCLAQTKVPPSTSASVEAQLSEKEARLEQLYADYWCTEYKIARGDTQASSLPIQQKIRELVNEPAFLKQLQSAHFDDSMLRRRQKLFLDEATNTFIFTEPKLAKLVEEMGNDEAAIVYQVGGRKLKRSELNNLVGHEPDREMRRLAWLARGQNDAVTASRIREAMKMRNELGAKYAGGSFVDFMLEHKGVPDRKRLLEIFAQVRRETEPEYQQLLARMRRELKVEKIEPWDIEYYFSTLTGEFESKLFERDQMWPKIKQVTNSIGFNFDKLPVDTTITEITFGGGTYPILYGKEVRILVNRYEGIRFTDTLMHEAGHGIHYSYISDPSFILRASSSEPFDEGTGQIISLMLYRPEIATRYFGLTPQQHALIAEAYRLKSLSDVRETIAETMFEYAAYENPDQDLAALYNKIYGEVMGVNMHGTPVWAFNPFFSTGPIYVQSYAVAEMFARQVHHDLDRRFDRHWDTRTGNYLRQHYFSVGGKWTLDEILKNGTGEELNPQYLIDAMKAH